VPSVEDLPAALRLLAQQSIDGSLAPETLQAIVERVHPLAIGAFEQARALTRRISRNALALHMQGDDSEERISRIVETLNGGLHSPAYPLARAEAAALGLPVVRPPAKLWHDMGALHGLYQQLLHRDLPEPAQPGAFFRFLALIES